MNRAERRRQEKAKAKDQVYTLTRSQIKQTSDKAAKRAMNELMILLFSIPCKVLYDHYGWRENKRLPEFGDHLCDEYQNFEDGLYDIEYYSEKVYELTGMKFVLDQDEEL